LPKTSGLNGGVRADTTQQEVISYYIKKEKREQSEFVTLDANCLLCKDG